MAPNLLQQDQQESMMQKHKSALQSWKGIAAKFQR